MAQAAGTFNETVLLPGLVALSVVLVLLSSIFSWLARFVGRVT